ncbi:DUF3817 domain-containing protein [Duganella sp. Dugasp56]|uniref:DUF3817 domain-containing protein n=1 Tax=Duganella sp. Dugasp56 TaxID=3243046 RepID=UPI0039AFBBAF
MHINQESTSQGSEIRRQLRKMRLASLMEGSTLLLLLAVAVPLKHLAGISVAVSVMGPVHGLAYVLYVWLLAQLLSSGDWTQGEVIRMAVVALIPFGALVNERAFARCERDLSTALR